MTKNPFDVIKATDLTNEEIINFWAECTTQDNKIISSFLDCCSVVPKYIIGSKGCGKTHALRYFSYEVKTQGKLGLSKVQSIAEDNYIGVLIKSEELNLHRFMGKSIEDGVWVNILAYYFELWVARQLIHITRDFIKDNTSEQNFCSNVIELFSTHPNISEVNFVNLTNYLNEELKKIDNAVNNCIFDNKLIAQIKINISHGDLIFGIPQILRNYFNELENVLFIYIIDQYEDYSENIQRYISTLVRNKKEKTTFWIGARFYGIKTHCTLSGETNKENAEYELKYLDNFYRTSDGNYKEFAYKMIKLRLEKICNIDLNADNLGQNDKFTLEARNENILGYKIPEKICKKNSYDREYYKKFINHFSSLELSSSDTEKIKTNIYFPDYPLLEKIGIFTVYQNWNKPNELVTLSEALKSNIEEVIKSNKVTGKIKKTLSHYKNDMLAQLYKDVNEPIYKFGLDELITLSWGNPRLLITLLRNIYSYGLFNGDISEGFIKIPIRTQVQGIKESVDGLFNEAGNSLGLKTSSKAIETSIHRICNLLRQIRFSSKPSECSLSTFTLDFAELSQEASEIITDAVNLLLLMEINEKSSQKNSVAIVKKYQISRLIATKYDLPLSSRGTIALTKEEANIIFSTNNGKEFNDVEKKRLARMEPPFAEKRFHGKSKKLPNYLSLLDEA